MTVRTDIRDAVLSLLNTGTPEGIPETTKRRYVPGEKLVESRIAAFFAEETDNRIGGPAGPLTKRSLTIALQAMVGVENPEDADDAVEPLLTHIVDRMGDTNLGGLALNVVEVSTLWASANDAGRFYLVALTRWQIEYQTRRADLTRKQ